MRKLINNIKSKIRLVLFLLWHDNPPRGATKWIALSTASLIGTLWGFPLENMTETKEMLEQKQYIIQIIGTYLLLAIGVALLIILLFTRYKKYKDKSNKLTEEEINNFFHHMNESE